MYLCFIILCLVNTYIYLKGSGIRVQAGSDARRARDGRDVVGQVSHARRARHARA